ncbi:glutamate-rich protein GrpB [Halobacillus sp. BBL2006]|nr:GrpB family protein [Halobacillus sp. BBL2006]KHE69042.1 glutamate-rich protein GrpB [Halobacillus sp. BBL2006]
MRRVEVRPYTESWVAEFIKEADKLVNIFGEEMIQVHHIGSTAIEGLPAKPIIDLMPVVKSIHRVEDFHEEMEGVGYLAKGENGIPGRRYFEKGGDDRTHHVHMFEEGDEQIERHLAFRDYVRAHPEVKKEYGNVKEKLAQRFPYDIASYIEGKADLVSSIEKRALEWYRKNK